MMMTGVPYRTNLNKCASLICWILNIYSWKATFLWEHMYRCLRYYFILRTGNPLEEPFGCLYLSSSWGTILVHWCPLQRWNVEPFLSKTWLLRRKWLNTPKWHHFSKQLLWGAVLAPLFSVCNYTTWGDLSGRP